MNSAQAQSYQLSAYVRSHAADFMHNDDKTDYQDFNWLDKPQALALNSLDSSALVVSGGHASAKVLASVGMLKTYASAYYPYGYDAQGHQVQYGYGNGTAQATFFDTLLVTSSTLAEGTPVSYRMDLSINGTLSSPSFESGGYLSADGLAEMRLRDKDSGQIATLSWDAKKNATGVYSLILNTQVGHTLTINGMLYAGADVSSYARTGRNAEADFYHSAYYQLAPSVAGLNTTGLSGHDFLATAVPEPASYLLLGLGLAGLGIRRRLKA
ncbi:PEP-CTERM sorting domain-containing protein [Paucibacter sp. KBW04]|uniref:PEP-CTERM sorting domain-containing protein n=1 Tax=Paucibacter sp. KBW04 TaxID=2153361 RepID=UPI0018CBF8D1|nr:PEP-CTERM sorting domain-containing protein [Paucibacter sp. KBW04]